MSYIKGQGGMVMKGKKIVISLAIIMAFIAVLFVSKQYVIASVGVPAVDYIAAKIRSNDEVAAEAEYDKTMCENLKEYKKIKAKENVQKQAQINTLEKRIKIFVGGNIKNFGMVYYDINSKKSIEINADKQFVAASTMKIPINMLMYDLIQDKKIDINEKIQYKECDYEDGAGVLDGTDLSKPIAIKTLSDDSIIHSDNIAINMILRKVGDKNKYDYIQKIVGRPIVHEGNNTTPRDSFKILERLYTNPENNEYYKTMIETMKKTEYHDRIDRYIPKEIVAHKIGDFGLYVNDIAIVCKDKPYILVVFTNDIPKADEVIGQVSKIIYDAQK